MKLVMLPVLQQILYLYRWIINFISYIRIIKLFNEFQLHVGAHFGSITFRAFDNHRIEEMKVSWIKCQIVHLVQENLWFKLFIRIIYLYYKNYFYNIKYLYYNEIQ